MTVDVTLEQITYERMAPLLNQAFYLGEWKREITLVEVMKTLATKSALPSWQKPKVGEPPSKRTTPFSMVFRFPLDHPLQQGMYQISHPVEGMFEAMFCVPIAEDEDGRYFETILS